MMTNTKKYTTSTLRGLAVCLVLMSTSTLLTAQADEGRLIVIDFEGEPVEALETQLEADSGHIAQSWFEFLGRSEDLTSTPKEAKAVNDLSMQSARVGAVEKPIEELKLVIHSSSDGKSTVHLFSKDVLEDEYPTELTGNEARRLRQIMREFETYVETGFYSE